MIIVLGYCNTGFYKSVLDFCWYQLGNLTSVKTSQPEYKQTLPNAVQMLEFKIISLCPPDCWGTDWQNLSICWKWALLHIYYPSLSETELCLKSASIHLHLSPKPNLIRCFHFKKKRVGEAKVLQQMGIDPPKVAVPSSFPVNTLCCLYCLHVLLYLIFKTRSLSWQSFFFLSTFPKTQWMAVAATMPLALSTHHKVQSVAEGHYCWRN